VQHRIVVPQHQPHRVGVPASGLKAERSGLKRQGRQGAVVMLDYDRLAGETHTQRRSPGDPAQGRGDEAFLFRATRCRSACRRKLGLGLQAVRVAPQDEPLATVADNSFVIRQLDRTADRLAHPLVLNRACDAHIMNDTG
jgi:hypothetical protein